MKKILTYAFIKKKEKKKNRKGESSKMLSEICLRNAGGKIHEKCTLHFI